MTERGAILSILVLVSYGGLVWWLTLKSTIWLAIVVVATLLVLTGADLLSKR